MGGRAEGQACAGPWARTPVGASGIVFVVVVWLKSHIFNYPFPQYTKQQNGDAEQIIFIWKLQQQIFEKPFKEIKEIDISRITSVLKYECRANLTEPIVFGTKVEKSVKFFLL